MTFCNDSLYDHSQLILHSSSLLSGHLELNFYLLIFIFLDFELVTFYFLQVSYFEVDQGLGQ